MLLHGIAQCKCSTLFWLFSYTIFTHFANKFFKVITVGTLLTNLTGSGGPFLSWFVRKSNFTLSTVLANIVLNMNNTLCTAHLQHSTVLQPWLTANASIATLSTYFCFRTSKILNINIDPLATVKIVCISESSKSKVHK